MILEWYVPSCVQSVVQQCAILETAWVYQYTLWVIIPKVSMTTVQRMSSIWSVVLYLTSMSSIM